MYHSCYDYSSWCVYLRQIMCSGGPQYQPHFLSQIVLSLSQTSTVPDCCGSSELLATVCQRSCVLGTWLPNNSSFQPSTHMAPAAALLNRKRHVHLQVCIMSVPSEDRLAPINLVKGQPPECCKCSSTPSLCATGNGTQVLCKNSKCS